MLGIKASCISPIPMLSDRLCVLFAITLRMSKHKILALGATAARNWLHMVYFGVHQRANGTTATQAQSLLTFRKLFTLCKRKGFIHFQSLSFSGPFLCKIALPIGLRRPYHALPARAPKPTRRRIAKELAGDRIDRPTLFTRLLHRVLLSKDGRILLSHPELGARRLYFPCRLISRFLFNALVGVVTAVQDAAPFRPISSGSYVLFRS